MGALEFQQVITSSLERLFAEAKKTEELGFVFSILGINSGEEDAGWQPIIETESFVNDLIGLVNSPVNENTKIRMCLVLYCHIMEASYFYHIIYNMMLTIKGETPKVFSFLKMYKGPVPPTVSKKIEIISSLGKEIGHDSLVNCLNEIYNCDIRNAFMHSNYILYNGELRLKHAGDRIRKIKFESIFELVQKTMHFYSATVSQQHSSLKSYSNGYIINGRKGKTGISLSSVKLNVNDETGVLQGFSTSDPLPLWDE